MDDENAPRHLTARHIECMRLVEKGADVLDFHVAKALRDVQWLHPEYINITRPLGRYKVLDRRPYFGAELTDAGRAALKEATP